MTSLLTTRLVGAARVCGAATALILLVSFDGAAQSAKKIADGVFLLPDRGGANAGWVDLGPDVLAIVGPSGQQHVAAIRRAAGKPIRAVFAPNGGTATTPGALQLIPASRGTVDGGIGFRGSMTLGKRKVEIRELERAVSAGNGIVYLPDVGVLFTGDLVGTGAVLDSTRTAAWAVVLDRLRRLDVKVVVPGRGPVGGPEVLEQTRSTLVGARTLARQGIERRASVDEIANGSQNAPLVRQVVREMVGLTPPPMVDELDLRPGPSFTSKTPGWTKPKVVVVMNMWPDKPGRMAELAYLAPGVEIRPAKSPAEAATLVGDADALLGSFNAEVFRRGTKLRWIQFPSAGVEGPLSIPGFADSPILLTNAQKIYGPPLAEHVFGMILGLTRRVHVAVPAMQARAWRDTAFKQLEMPEVRGKTLLVVGLGGIGTEVANIGHGMGMRVIATRNNKTPPTEIVDYVGSASELPTLAAEADFVVNCLPLTPATANTFNEALFRIMKPTAIFVNIGRGGTVDTEALTRALEERRLAGAGLDVTRPEPLPADHRLWSAPNVIITPHVGSNSDWERERTWFLFRENLRRFVIGEPLLSVVDKKAAY